MRRLLLSLCLVLMLATGPAWAFFSLSDARNAMVDFLLDQLSTEGEFVITAEEVTELEEGSTAIRGLKIEDAEGVWFTADSLSFTWDASRLLSGEVEFNSLVMSDVEVLRQPVQPPTLDVEEDVKSPQEEGTFVWPRSPITLRIDRMALERVSIAEAVLGSAIAFDAEGSARDEGDIQSVTLNLKRTDDITGTIDFTYARNFADNTLKVELAAAEAAGGLVAHLAGLPDDAPSSLTLTADGPPTDWKSRFSLDLAETIAADGTADISYEGPLSVDAEVNARPGPKLSPDVAILLGDEAKLAARVTQQPDGSFRIAEGRIASPELKMTATGTFAPVTGYSDVSVDLSAGGRLAEPIDGVDFNGLSFTGRITGPVGDMRARGDLTLEGLKTAPADVESATLAIDVVSTGAKWARRTVFDVSGQTRGLRLDQIGADVIGQAGLTLVGSLANDALALEKFALDSNVLKVTAAGTGNISDNVYNLTFGLSAPDMTPVVAAYGVDASGRIRLDGTFNMRGDTMRLETSAALEDFVHPMAEAASLKLDGTVVSANEDITFDLRGSGERLRLDRIGPDLLPQASLSAKGDLADGTLRLERFELSSPLLAASGAGRMVMETGAGEIRYDITVSDLERIATRYDAPLSGSLAAVGNATLPEGGDPRLVGDLTIDRLAWQGTAYGDLALTHDARISATPEGTLRLTLDGSPYGDAAVSTRFAYAEPNLTLEGLDASALGLTATGDLAIATDGPLLDGKLNVTASDLAPAGRLAGLALRGNGSGSISLTSRDARQDAAANLALNGLSIDGTTIRGAKIDARLSDLFGRMALDTRARLNGIAAGDARIESASLTARGPLSGLNIQADVNGQALDKPLTATMAARVNAESDPLMANVSRLQATLGEDRIVLNSPLRITSRGGVTGLKGLDVSLPDNGSLSGDLTLAGRPIAGSLNVRLPSLAFLKRFADIPVRKGAVDARATFDRRGGTAEVNARGMEFENVDAAGAMDITASADWKGRTLTLDATAEGGFGDPVRATATLPLQTSGGLPMIARRGPIEGRVVWAGEIGELWALVPLPGHVVTGRTRVDLGVSGDISNPQLAGGIEIDNGSYQNLDIGTILTDLTVDTSLLDGDLGLKLTANDGADGRVTVDGRVALDASGIDLTARVDHAVLVRRDDVAARIDGDVAIRGPATALDVTGALVIEEAEVRLVNASTPSIVTLGDVRIKGAPPATEKEKSSTIDLDLTITSPGRIFVRGRGLDSQWGANLRVTGDAANPVVTGTIERERGQLDLIGKSFDLERGTVRFDGGRKIDPSIDVTLKRATTDLTGSIVITGRASSPELAFTSSPALPEDEVMPRLLFGKSRQALTGSQAIQLSIGLATLMDGGAGTLDAARTAIGLDQLRIDQDAEGNASVTIGKEVADGVFVGTERSLGEGGTKVTVEIDVFKDITVDTEIDSDGGASVGLEWKKDF